MSRAFVGENGEEEVAKLISSECLDCNLPFMDSLSKILNARKYFNDNMENVYFLRDIFIMILLFNIIT